MSFCVGSTPAGIGEAVAVDAGGAAAVAIGVAVGAAIGVRLGAVVGVCDGSRVGLDGSVGLSTARHASNHMLMPIKMIA